MADQPEPKKPETSNLGLRASIAAYAALTYAALFSRDRSQPGSDVQIVSEPLRYDQKPEGSTAPEFTVTHSPAGDSTHIEGGNPYKIILGAGKTAPFYRDPDQDNLIFPFPDEGRIPYNVSLPSAPKYDIGEMVRQLEIAHNETVRASPLYAHAMNLLEAELNTREASPLDLIASEGNTIIDQARMHEAVTRLTVAPIDSLAIVDPGFKEALLLAAKDMGYQKPTE